MGLIDEQGRPWSQERSEGHLVYCLVVCQLGPRLPTPVHSQIPPVLVSKLRVRLGEFAARTQEALEQSITAAVNLMTANGAIGWFHHRDLVASRPARP